jgi:hypothetical protein
MRFRILAAGLLVSCASSLTQVGPGSDFELEPGKPVQLSGTGVRVTLLEVVNDSRCPVDVVCVTAGDAEVRLSVVGEGEDRTVSLHVMQEPRSVTIGAVRLELTGLTPSPRSTVTIPPAEYRARIRWSAP